MWNLQLAAEVAWSYFASAATADKPLSKALNFHAGAGEVNQATSRRLWLYWAPLRYEYAAGKNIFHHKQNDGAQ